MGKGSGDSRSPDFKARRESYDRIYGNGSASHMDLFLKELREARNVLALCDKVDVGLYDVVVMGKVPFKDKENK